MTGLEIAHGLVRGLHVAATLSSFGAMTFRAIVAPVLPEGGRPADRIAGLLRVSVMIAGLVGAAWLVLEASTVAGEDDTIPATIRIVLLELRFGWLLIARLALLVLAAAVFGRGQRAWRRYGAAALAGGAVALQAGLGHGASMDGWTGRGLAAVEALHLLAAGAWLGGLLPLYVVVGAVEPERSLAAARRFSRLGIGCVSVLMGTILVQGWVLIGGVPGLIGTDYGLVASVKIVLFAMLLGFAAANRFRRTPALVGPHEEEGRRRLRHSIAAETLVGVCVILAAGVLLTLRPAMHQQPIWPLPFQFGLAAQVDPGQGCPRASTKTRAPGLPVAPSRSNGRSKRERAMQVKRADAVLGAAPAAMPGMPVIGVLGFSHVEKFRNAAHDVRLSIGFRCH